MNLFGYNPVLLTILPFFRNLILIEIYGQTFSNKDHGRNLFTKLLLENRIIFEQIKLEDVWNLNYLY